MKFRSIQIFIAFLLLGLSFPAFAQNSDEAPDILKMVQDGQYDQARKSLLSVSRNLFDIILLDVEIARAQGRTEDAIELLDEVLIQIPNFTIGRAKLAQLLVEDKQFERAQYQYEILLERASDDEERTFFSDRLEEVSSIQPYDFSIQASVAPSNNINSGYSEKNYCKYIQSQEYCGQYPEELVAQFGWRTQISASGDYTWNLVDQHSLQIGLSSVVNHYSVPTLENQSATLSANYVFQNAINKISVGPFLSRYWGDGKSYSHNLTTDEADLDYENENYDTKGIAFSARHIINSSSVINFSASHRRSVYDQNSITGNYKNSYNVNYTYNLDALRSWDLSFGTSVFKQDVGGDWVGSANYRSVNFGVGYNQLFENNWYLGTSISFEMENHSDRYYPFSQNIYRKDKIYDFAVEIRNQDWKVGKSVPSLNCDLSKTNSNIEDRNIRSLSCGIYLVNRF